MHIKLKKEAQINHEKTQEFIRNCIKSQKTLEFHYDKEFLIYRMILASLKPNDVIHISDDVDLVKFYIFDEEIDLLNNTGMDSLIEALNSKDKKESFSIMFKSLNENMNDYFDNEKKEDFLVRFVLKLFLSDRFSDKYTFKDLSNIATLDINGCKIDAVPGVRRIANWIDFK